MLSMNSMNSIKLPENAHFRKRFNLQRAASLLQESDYHEMGNRYKFSERDECTPELEEFWRNTLQWQVYKHAPILSDSVSRERNH